MNTPNTQVVGRHTSTRLLNQLHLNRSRLVSLAALIALASGSLGQWVLQWQPQTINFTAWDQYFFSLLLAKENGSLSISQFFQTPQGPFGAVGSLWYFLGHILNSQMADPMWQTFWRGLWRVAIVAAGYWTLTSRRNIRANWFIALAAAGIAAFPTDWRNLLFAAGTSQLIATFAGLLAIHCWLKTSTGHARNANESGKFGQSNTSWWIGWGWFALAALSAPVGVLAAVAAGVTTLTQAVSHPNSGQKFKGIALLAAGVLGAVIISMAQTSPVLVHPIVSTIHNLLVVMSHPFSDMLWPALVMWLPWCVLLWRSIQQQTNTQTNTQANTRTHKNTQQDHKLIALGLWVLMMMLLLAAGESLEIQNSIWLNPSCVLLGLLVNTASLLRCMPVGFWQTAREQLQRYNQPHAHVKSNAIPLGRCLLFGWFVLVALGYWQSANDLSGWQRAVGSHLSQRAIHDTQIHRYLASGDANWLTPNAPLNGGGDLTAKRSWLDAPQIKNILPAQLLPPLKPINYLSAGQAQRPQFAPNIALYRHNAMGIVQTGQPPYINSRLGLRYQRPAGHHHYLLSTRTRGAFANNFELYFKDGSTDASKKIELISASHPLPKDALISRSIAGLPLASTFAFTANADIFELDLLRAQSAKPGLLLFTSPMPVGLARYHLARWLPYFAFLAGMGLVTLLVIAGRIFLVTAAPSSLTSSAVATNNPPAVLTINANWLQTYAPLFGTLIAAAAILFIRKSDALLNPQFWAEDGSTFFAGHFHLGFAAIYEPYAGYLHLTPRLIAFFTGIFTPYAYVPHVYNYCTLAAMLLVIGCCFSKRLPFSVSQKCLMGLATVLMVQFSGEIYLNITNLQWFMAPLLILLALKAPPAPTYATKLTSVKTQWAIDLLTLALVGLTGPFIILAFPFFALMAVVKRNRHSVVLLFGAGVAMFIQMAFLFTSDRPHDAPMPQDFPLSWVLPQVVGQRIFKEWMIFGLYDMYIWPALLCTLLVGVYAALLFFAARHRTLRWPLVCFVIFHGLTLAAGLFRVKSVLLTLMLPSVSRYFFIPLLMLTWAVIVLLGSPVKWQRRAALFVLACVLTSSLQTFFIARAWPDLNWRSYARQISKDKPMNIPIQPTHLNFLIRLNPEAAAAPSEPATETPSQSPANSTATPATNLPDTAE